MSNLRKLLVGVAVFSLVLVAFNAVAFAQSSAPEVTVKIGVMAPITGPAGSLGTEQLNWAKQALADFNEETGWNVEMVEGDTQIDPAIAVTVAQSMISDADIYGVVGPAGSQEVEATQQMFKDAGLVHVSGSATRPSLTTTGFDTFFRTVPTDAAQGPTDGNFLADDLGVTKLFIIDDKTSYSTGLADETQKAFEAAGGEVVGHEEVNQDDTDFSTLVTKAAGAGAEAIYFPGQIASQGALLAQAIQEQGADIIVFGADGFFSVEDFIKGAAGATEGSYVSFFAPDMHTVEASADLVKRYTDEYGEFSGFGTPTYVATMVVLEAFQRAFEAGDLSRAAVRDQVAETDMEPSALGIPLTFDENGDISVTDFYVLQVKGDGFVLVSGGDSEAEPAATEEASG